MTEVSREPKNVRLKIKNKEVFNTLGCTKIDKVLRGCPMAVVAIPYHLALTLLGGGYTLHLHRKLLRPRIKIKSNCFESHSSGTKDRKLCL